MQNSKDALQPLQQGSQAAHGALGQGAQTMISSTQGMQDIHDIRPPVQVGIDPVIFKIVFIVLGVIILLFLGILLYRYFRKRMGRTGKDTLPALPPPLPADQAALVELALIADLMTESPRLYYFRLTALLQCFIGKIFGINAPEMTSQELVASLSRLTIDRELVGPARELFLSASMVKYAAVVPDMDRMRSDEEFTRKFIASVKLSNDQDKRNDPENSKEKA